MCRGSTCEVVVMADWQLLRTGNKSNNHRSLRTCLLARARQPHAAHGRACLSRAPCAAPPALASRLRMQQHGAPERLGIRARAGDRRGGYHVQRRARVRRRGDLRHERNGASPFGRARRSAPRLRACGGPAPDRRRAQKSGGAIYMADGAVTFRGSSTITRTRAVRPARRTRARTHLLIVLVSNAVASTGSGT